MRVRRSIPRWLTDLQLPSFRYRRGRLTVMPVKGELVYVINGDHVDALDAFQANLQLVVDELDRSGLDYFAEWGLWGERPLLGMIREDAYTILNALRTRAREKPVYLQSLARSGWRRARLASKVSDSELRALARDGFSVFQVLRNERTGRKFSDDYGCMISTWNEVTEHGLENTTPREGITTHIGEPLTESVKVEAHGIPIDSLKAIAGPLTTRYDFPIDVVYLWVDGSDPEWQERKARRLGSASSPAHIEGQMEQRYRHFDELRYSLRSLERFAPWVRNVYLVTDQQSPAWLDESGTNLRVVDHSEILPSQARPTFNSHALTASLHRIEGIAEHFVLFNDDMLLGSPVRPEEFFDTNGVSHFFLSRSLINARPELAHEGARVHSSDVIAAVTGKRPRHVLKHAPYTFNRTLLESIEDELSDVWSKTVSSPFRSGTDVVPEYIHHYLGYDRGLSRPANIAYGYFAVGTDPSTSGLRQYQRGKPAHVFCVNDEGSPGEMYDVIHSQLTRFFETEFPHVSKYEID